MESGQDACCLSIGVNLEGYWDSDLAFEVQDFFMELHVQTEKLGLRGFHIDWYDSNDSRRQLSFG